MSRKKPRSNMVMRDKLNVAKILLVTTADNLVIRNHQVHLPSSMLRYENRSVTADVRGLAK